MILDTVCYVDGNIDIYSDYLEKIVFPNNFKALGSEEDYADIKLYCDRLKELFLPDRFVGVDIHSKSLKNLSVTEALVSLYISSLSLENIDYRPAVLDSVKKEWLLSKLNNSGTKIHFYEIALAGDLVILPYVKEMKVEKTNKSIAICHFSVLILVKPKIWKHLLWILMDWEWEE